ncbi:MULTISPECIES: bifunctional diguanylate cyclase/phosphodiesterase [Caballeronia]|uniref:bifunctional diguanylate cyclase/phosphodiesterase n=1 Tax=Caballeronia TaxID=1827195 RepID=UPI001FD61EBA|nr:MULTISPECIES: EAL domain-containing protein [Caballeronia]MDR5799095.1 EAL domain-containing protein [Caballeronia sp. LZ001]
MVRWGGKGSKNTRGVFLPLVYVGAAIAALVFSFVIYEIYDARADTQDEVQRDLKVLSSAAASQLKDYMDSVSDVLSAAGISARPGLRAPQSGPDAAQTLAAVQSTQIGTPVSSLVVVDTAGAPVLHTGPDPVPWSFTIGKIAIGAARTAHTDRIILLGPVRSDVDGSIGVYATKRVLDGSGQLIGAVITPLTVSNVAFVGKEAIRKTGVFVSVMSLEGKLIARFPDPGSMKNLKSYGGDAVHREISTHVSGFVTATSSIDGVKRLMAYERVAGYPLAIITGMNEQEIRARWQADAVRFILIAYLSLAVVVLLLVIIHRQLRQLSRRTAAVEESEQRFDRVLQELTDAVYVRDRDGQIVVANRKFGLLFGAGDTRSLIGKNVVDLLAHTTKQMVTEVNNRVLNSHGAPLSLEIETATHDSVLPIEYTFSAVDISGQSHVLCQMRDVTTRRQYEARLVKQATFDEITGLPNRRLYIDRLSNALHRSKRDGTRCAVMFIDLDHFKRVNDTLGHPFGDQLLIAAAQRLSGLLRPGHTVARFGGDEFVLLMSDFTDPMECRIVAESIVEAFAAPFEVAARSISVGASVGVSVFPGDGTEPDILLQHADTAMYEAKSAGRSAFCFFDHDMNARVHDMLRIDARIRSALARNEISVLYQPIIDPVTHEIVKAEALARWHSQDLGHVPPDKFIPVAEENGSIAQIGDWVLQEACMNAAKWSRELTSPITVSVNVSAKQFDDPTFVDSVFAALETSKLPAHLLELEITERVLISDDETALETISALREIGVGLSLDDFGTGYSSLSYLTKFPLNTIKIDRAFVRDLEHDEQTQNLTRAIIAMAKSLDLKLIAEGVETQEQADKLVLYGCEYLQGFYFGRPMTSGELIELSSKN